MFAFRSRRVGSALVGVALLLAGCGGEAPLDPAGLAAGTFTARATGWVLSLNGARDSLDQRLEGSACFSNGWLYLDTPGLTLRGVATLPAIPAVPTTLTLPGEGDAAPQAWVNAASLSGGSIEATEGTITVTAFTGSEVTGSFHWTGSPSALLARGVVAFTGSLRAVRRADCYPGT